MISDRIFAFCFKISIQVDELIVKYASKYEGKLLEFLDVCNVMDNLKKEEERNVAEVNLPEHWMEELNDVFTVFDKDNNGFIETSDLPLAMRCLRINTTEEEIQHLIPFGGNYQTSSFVEDCRTIT